MIPNDYKVATPEKKEYDLLPADTYEVEIENIELKKDQKVYQSEEVEDRFKFTFKIVEESEFKGRKLWKDMRPIMSAGSKGYTASSLYQIYCAVNQASLTDDEAKGVGSDGINDMVGMKLRLVVMQKPNQKGVMQNKISGYLPVKNTKPASAVTDDTIQIDDNDIPF